jgi:multimeric flavodoxin WrbA
MKAYVISDGEYQTETFEQLDQAICGYLTEKGFETEKAQIGKDDLAYCMGCFGCWIKKPGECVIEDGISKINRTSMNSDVVIDLWLPNMLPFFLTRPDGSSMHPARYNDYPNQIMIGYGENLSEYFASLEENHIKSDGIQVNHVNVRQNVISKTEDAFKIMLESDAMIFTFPLYFFCLPGLLMRFLQDYYQYFEQHKNDTIKAKVYAVVNCGFPEPDINEEAVRVIQSFSQKIEAEFRFGVLIGGGGMILGTKEAPFMKKTMTKITGAFELMKNDISSNNLALQKNIYITAKFPRRLFFFMANQGWSSFARKNGLKKKDLYRKPYREIF